MKESSKRETFKFCSKRTHLGSPKTDCGGHDVLLPCRTRPPESRRDSVREAGNPPHHEPRPTSSGLRSAAKQEMETQF